MTAIRYAIPAPLAEIPDDRHTVIEASAGTGKTYLIEHRVVDLLLRAGVELESILVVTFTEKATEELRARVRALIGRVLDAREHTATAGEPHWLVDDDARAALRRALHAFDRAPIHTIHGFCHRVLTENAFANRRLFEQTQVDRESAFGAAFKACLRTELARGAEHRPYLEAWLRAGRSLGDLQKLLLDAAGAGGALEPAFDEAAVAAAIDALPALDPDALRADAASITAAMTFARMHAKTATAMFEAAVALADVVRAGRGGHPALLLAAIEAGGALSLLLDKLSGKKIKDERVAAIRDLAIAVGQAVVPLSAAVVQRFLPPVLARLAADKRRGGLFDFDDMLALVWESLCADGGDELAARLRAQYRFALIDEFQDTDQLQWRIFARLYLDAGDAANTLCVIGDPKQAIYGFRGADVHAYLDARDAILAGGGQRVALTDNYRASAALVDAYNELLRQDADQPLFTGEITYDEPVVARAAVTADGPPVTLLKVSAPGKLNNDEIKAALGPAIAREIEAIVGTLRWTNGGEEAPVRHGDVFVLTRSLKESVQMAGHLRAEGVPCALYKQEGLFQTPEASDIRLLLRGVAQPHLQSERFQAWQTPFFAVPLAELIHARDLPDAHPLIARLLDWRRLADQQAWERLFDGILADSGLIRRELFLRNSERALTNYLHLFELLLEEAHSARLDLPELIRRLEHYIGLTEQGDGSDRNVQRLESERNAVQIMTMHKAKGLEAAVVFLFGNFTKPPARGVRVYHRDRRRIAHVGTPADKALKDLIEDERRQEDQRLLYVSLTRAKVRLYLPYVATTQASLKGPYNYLRRQLDRVLDDPRFDVREVIAGATAAPQPPAGALADWSPPAELLAEPAVDERYERWREQRRGPYVTSYTRMKHAAASAPPLEAEEAKVGIDRASAPPAPGELPGGAATGVFLHDVLERLPLASFSSSPPFDRWRRLDDVDRLFRSQMLRHGRDPDHLEHAQRLVYQSVTAPIDLGGATLDGVWRCSDEGREVEFVYPTADGGFVKGFIDMLFEHDGRVYLLDWKSDTLPDYGAGALAEHARIHYGLQASLYSRAAARLLRIESAADYDARFGGMLFCFLRGPAFWRARPEWREVTP